MTTKMEITVGSVPDRENLVAELWYDNVMWCEISKEESDFTLEIYPNPSGKPWAFKFEEAVAFLQQAERRLQNLDEPMPKQMSLETESTKPKSEMERPSFAKQAAQVTADPVIQSDLPVAESN